MLAPQSQDNTSPAAEFNSSISHLEDLVLPFGVDVRVPQADGVHRVTLPIPLEYEDPSGESYFHLFPVLFVYYWFDWRGKSYTGYKTLRFVKPSKSIHHSHLNPF